MARSRGRQFSSGSARVQRPPLRKFWELGPGGDDLATLDGVAFSSDASAILGAGVTPVGQNLTIIRTHGFMEFILSTADASLSGFNFAAGIGIVSADAFAVGSGSMPDPFDDIGWPGWLWHRMGAIHTPLALAAGSGPTNTMTWEIDSKAMRKLGLNEVAFIKVQGGEVVNAAVTVRAATRMLISVSLS